MKLKTLKYFTKDMSDSSEVVFESFKGKEIDFNNIQCNQIGKDKDGKDIYKIVLRKW